MNSSDCGGDLHQKYRGYGADHITQQVDGLRGLELLQGIKVLGIEPSVLLQAHPVEQQKRNAVFHQPLKLVLLHRQSRFLEQRPVAADHGGGVASGGFKNCHGQHRGCGGELLGQQFQQEPVVLRCHRPQRHWPGCLGGVGVLYVEVIFHLGPALAAAKHGDACGAPPGAASKLPFPLVLGQHRHGIGPLVMDQQLILEWVAEIPPGAMQKRQPVLRRGCDGFQCFLVKLNELLGTLCQVIL